jgi:hypothetical protein
VFGYKTQATKIKIKTSDLTFVKRVTERQAMRATHLWTMGHEEPNGFDRRMTDGEDEDDEYPGELSESEDEPSPERFL